MRMLQPALLTKRSMWLKCSSTAATSPWMLLKSRTSRSAGKHWRPSLRICCQTGKRSFVAFCDLYVSAGSGQRLAKRTGLDRVWFQQRVLPCPTNPIASELVMTRSSRPKDNLQEASFAFIKALEPHRPILEGSHYGKERFDTDRSPR